MQLELKDKDDIETLGGILGEISFNIDLLPKIASKENPEGLTYDKYKSDRTTRDGIGMRISTIGELIKRLTKRDEIGKPDRYKIEREFPDLRWNDIKGMRNIIAHNYTYVKRVCIWRAYANFVPKLQRVISAILEQYPDVKEQYEKSKSNCIEEDEKDAIASMLYDGSKDYDESLFEDDYDITDPVIEGEERSENIRCFIPVQNKKKSSPKM